MSISLSGIELSPDVFLAVMATGILSVAARNHHYGWVGAALGVAATLGLLGLVAAAVAGVATRRWIAAWNLTDPDVTLRLGAAVGGVAGSCSWCLGVGQCRYVRFGDFGRSGGAVHGSSLLAGGRGGTWVAAMVLYGLMTWLIVWRAVSEWQGRHGFEPDTWIMMGALAVATLAGDDIHQLVRGGLADAVRAVTVVTWVVATLWIPPLIYFGLHRISRRPEVLRFGGAWWTLVFPLGMYSVATDAAAGVSSVGCDSGEFDGGPGPVPARRGTIAAR